MADSNQNRRDGFAGFSDNDPFAELTRIMGHDPRTTQASGNEPAHQSDTGAESAYEDDFSIDLEQELMGELDLAEFEPRLESRGQESESFAPEAQHPHEEVTVATGQPFNTSEPESEVPSYDDFGDALERELMGDVFESEPAREEVAQPASFIAEPHAPFEDPQAHAFVDAEDSSWERRPPEEDVTAYETPQYEQPHIAQVVEEGRSAELTLEEELHALLGQEPTAPQAPFPSEAAQQTPVLPISRSNYVTATTHAPAAPPPSVDPQPMEALDDRVDALLRHDAHETAPSDIEEPILVEDDFDEIFARDLDLQFGGDAENGPIEQAEPEIAAVPFIAPPVADITGLDALAAWQPESERVAQPAIRAVDDAPATSGVSREVPEIETVDLHEMPVPLEDDLDIPDVAYETAAPVAGPYDDLEGEIAEAFGDLSLEEPASAAVPSQSEAPNEWAGMAAATAAAATGAAFATTRGPQTAQPSSGTNYDFGQASWDASPSSKSQDDFDYEADLEEAIAMASYGEGARVAAPPRRRRAPMIAALVAGVAVIGGAGVLAMSLFGGASDVPAVVLADTEPMKVKPENPGGVTVPNQDSQVYQRVATGEPEPAPSQTRLISTAEDPVDVTAQGAVESELPPGVSDLLASSGGEPGSASGKSEERLAPSAEAEVSGIAEEVAVVAPRRVRTMVVRPDGTMVPREEIAPANSAPQGGDTVIAAPQLSEATPLEAPGAPATARTGLETANTGDDAEPLVTMPDTVGVVPSQRSEPPASVAAAPVTRQPEAAQRPAATPVSAPAAAATSQAATSEWSMQIASQPTAEGAQSSYQDLARRYGDVLAGRGVNIVRADIQGKGTYYRVRIPASNRDEAIQLCTRYKSAGGSCFVSR